MLHEALDRRFAGPVRIVHALRDLALIIEGQPLLGARRDEVEVAADRPQEARGLLELTELVRREKPLFDQLRGGAHLIGIFPDPEQCVEIAQAALPFLDVGLDHVAAVAHPLVAGVPLLELLGHEFLRIAGDDFLPEAAMGLVEKRLVPPDVAGFQIAVRIV